MIKRFSIEEQKLSNLQKFLIYSILQLQIDQCESFDVGVDLTSIIVLLFKCEKKYYMIIYMFFLH
jgi:hypothetical protein